MAVWLQRKAEFFDDRSVEQVLLVLISVLRSDCRRRPLSWTFTLMGPASTYNHDQGLSFFMSGTEAEISRRWSRLLQAAGCSRVAEDGHSSRSKGTRSTEVQRAAASGRKHGQHHQTTKFESEEEFPPLPTGAVLRSTR